MAEPRKVLIAGDWHGNLRWASAIVGLLPDLLADESPRIIVHVGDFGVWPGRAGERYLAELADALHGANAMVMFVDGNHEDHAGLQRSWRDQGRPLAPQPLNFRGDLWWLPRGTRWTWRDRTWVAAGGAVSVDRAFRRAGRDWWPEEEISEGDHQRIVSPGRADVMLCHDAPTTVPMTFGQWPSGWDIADKARADAHRDRLQAIVDEVRPTHLFHGHYHRWHDLTVPMGHGNVRVVGLDMDDSLYGNVRVLDVESMQLEDIS